MMQVRAYIIHSSNEALAMACTIAIRYSTIRRQGYNADVEKKRETNAPNELQVLDYRQQQYRLLPLVNNNIVYDPYWRHLFGAYITAFLDLWVMLHID